MVNAGLHAIGGWNFPVSDRGPGVPQIIESKATWTSESCADHPEPARLSVGMRVPRIVWPLLNIDNGDYVNTYVWARGIKSAAKYVAYFEGEVEGIELFPTRGEGFVAVHHTVDSVASSGSISLRHDSYREPITITNNDGENAHWVQFQLWFQVPVTSTTTESSSGGRYRQQGLRVTSIGRNLANVFDGGVPRVTYVADGIQRTDVIDIKGDTYNGWIPLTVYIPNIAPGTSYQFIFTSHEKYTGRPDGYDVRIVGGDMLSKLGRTFIGAEPWSAESVASRLYYQLGDALAGKGVNIDWYPRNDFEMEPGGDSLVYGTRVRPRDVDNVSALEVYRDAVAALGRVAIGLADRVGISWGLRPANRIINNPNSPGTPILAEDTAGVARLPSSAVPQGSVGKDVGKISTRFTAAYYNPGEEYPVKPTDVSEQWSGWELPDAVNKYGVVARQLKTDAWTEDTTLGLQALAPSLYSKLEMMATEQSRSRYYFTNDVEVLSNRLDDVVGLAELVDNSTRFGQLFKFDGVLPPMIERYHRMRGGSFGFSEGKWRLTIEAEPANYSGVDTATFADASTDLTLGGYKSTDITIDDLRGVSSL